MNTSKRPVKTHIVDIMRALRASMRIVAVRRAVEAE
jgi:DNA-binding NarL/FixJ family response regulator